MNNKPLFVGEWVSLGDCFPYIKNGYNVKQGKDKCGIPITRIETLSENRFNPDKVGYADIYDITGLEDRILADGDILMSHINSIRYLGRAVMYRSIPGETYIHGMNLLRLKADREIVLPAYAEAYFGTRYFKRQIDRIAKKSVNQASFSVGNLKELKFPLIPLSDQEKIVTNLNTINVEIARSREQIEHLDQLVKSRFVEMFGTSRNPSFEVVPLEKACDIIVDCPHQTPKYQGELTHPAIRTTELVGTSINWTTMKYVSEEEYLLRTKRLKPEPGDVVYAREGVYGTAAILPAGYQFCLGQRTMLYRPNYKLCTSSYLLYALTSDDVMTQANKLNIGSTVPHVNVKDAKRFLVMLPPLALQQEFSAFVA